MANVLVYYAHPGHKHSLANKAMMAAAKRVAGITFVDLYAEYPRFEIDIALEQQRLLEHDVILLQFPMFWYSTPSLVKEWLDVVLEFGFAYGAGGDKLSGKFMLLAVTAAAQKDAHINAGYSNFPLRTILTPLEQTAKLCRMTFLAPYVLYGSLQDSQDDLLAAHAEGYRKILEALRDDRYDLQSAARGEVVSSGHLPIREVHQHG
jgi:putative NADPH-quinone reductase